MEDILRQLLLANTAPQKTTEVFGEAVRMDELTYDNTKLIWVGSLVKLREMEKINIYKYSGGKHDIDLTDDEFVGEETSFIYLPSQQILVLQSNKYGVSASGVEFYFQHFMNDEGLALKPIMNEKEYEKFLKKKVVTTIDVDIAIPEEGFLSDQVAGWAFGDVQKLRTQLGAMKLSATLTVEDSRKDTLDLKTAVKLVTELRESKKTSKLKAKARAHEGAKLEELDFLKGRMRAEFFRRIERGKSLTPYAVQELAIEAYNQKKDELNQLFMEKRD